MTDKPSLIELADRVEAAAGPNYALEVAIFKMLHPEYACYVQGRGGLIHPCDGSDVRVLSDVRPGNYTASLDAATSLFPEDCFYRSGHDGAGPDPSLFFCEAIPVKDGLPLPTVRAVALTEPLARTACALRAIAASVGEGA